MLYVSFHILPVFVHVVGYVVEHAPDADFAEAGAAKVNGSIGVGEAKVFVFSFKKTVFAGKADDVRRVDGLYVFIFHKKIKIVSGNGGFSIGPREGGNACVVGMSAHISVGNHACYPHGAFMSVAFSDKFQNPHFVGIGNRKRFAGAGVAVGAHKFVINADGFAGGSGTLQRKVDKAAIIDDGAFLAFEFRQSTISGFAYRNLKLVDVAHYVVGLCGLFYFPKIFPGIPFVHIHQGSFGPGGCSPVIQLTIQHVRVGGVRNHRRSIYRGALGDEIIGAGFGTENPRSRDKKS